MMKSNPISTSIWIFLDTMIQKTIQVVKIRGSSRMVMMIAKYKSTTRLKIIISCTLLRLSTTCRSFKIRLTTHLKILQLFYTNYWLFNSNCRLVHCTNEEYRTVNKFLNYLMKHFGHYSLGVLENNILFELIFAL